MQGKYKPVLNLEFQNNKIKQFQNNTLKELLRIKIKINSYH